MKKLHLYRLNQGMHSIFTIYDVVHRTFKKKIVGQSHQQNFASTVVPIHIGRYIFSQDRPANVYILEF